MAMWTQNLTGSRLFPLRKWKIKIKCILILNNFNLNLSRLNNNIVPPPPAIVPPLLPLNSFLTNTTVQLPSALRLTSILQCSLLRCKMPGRQILFEMKNNNHCCHSVCFSSVATATRVQRKKNETKLLMDKSTDNGPNEHDLSLEELQLKIKEKRTKHSHVYKQSVAETIVTTIMKHRTNPGSPVLDVRAGPGFVSREFLKQGVSKVVALENNSHFSPFLLSLQNEVPSGQFCFFNWQIDNLYLKLHCSTHNDSVQAFLKMEAEVAEALITPQSSSSDVPYSLVSIGGQKNNEHFVFFILRNLSNEDPILSHGRIETFFLAHPRFKYKIDYLASLPKTNVGVPAGIRDKSLAIRFNYTHALVHLLYDIDMLGEFDVDDFFPPFNSIAAKHDKGIDPSKRFLMRMQLKKNIDDILPLEHHIPFLNFMFQIYKKKSVRMIPAMEMLIPGCGLRMVAEGFTMMDIIIMSNPEEFIRLYKMMLEWPEYRSSPLHGYLMTRMTGSMEDASLSDGDEH